jgi:hypothetical protein
MCLFSLKGQQAVAQVVMAENVATPAAERISFKRQPISMIPAGTKFGEQPPAGWSHLISFVRGQLSSGDIESVSETVRYYGEIFNLVMLGNAEPNAEGKYELDKVAIGFSMKIKGVNTIVTSETQKELGAGLNILGRGVLDGNIESLANVEQVARTTNSIVIDAPAIMLRDGKHREMIVRYYIWVFPENGNLGTLVWLLDSTPDQSELSIADTTIQLLPANMREDRVMHVDASKFNLLGIPSKDAFALVRLPQGVAFQMSESMQSIAAEKNYDAETLAKLTTAVAETLKTGKQDE